MNKYCGCINVEVSVLQFSFDVNGKEKKKQFILRA